MKTNEQVEKIVQAALSVFDEVCPGLNRDWRKRRDRFEDKLRNSLIRTMGDP